MVFRNQATATPRYLLRKRLYISPIDCKNTFFGRSGNAISWDFSLSLYRQANRTSQCVLREGEINKCTLPSRSLLRTWHQIAELQETGSEKGAKAAAEGCYRVCVRTFTGDTQVQHWMHKPMHADRARRDLPRPESLMIYWINNSINYLKSTS